MKKAIWALTPLTLISLVLMSCKTDLVVPQQTDSGSTPLTSISGKVANWKVGKAGTIKMTTGSTSDIIGQTSVDTNGNFTLVFPSANTAAPYLIDMNLPDSCPSVKLTPIPKYVSLSLNVVGSTGLNAGSLYLASNEGFIPGILTPGSIVAFLYSTINFSETGDCVTSFGTTSFQIQGKTGWNAITVTRINTSDSKASTTVKTGAISSSFSWYVFDSAKLTANP